MALVGEEETLNPEPCYAGSWKSQSLELAERLPDLGNLRCPLEVIGLCRGNLVFFSRCFAKEACGHIVFVFNASQRKAAKGLVLVASYN